MTLEEAFKIGLDRVNARLAEKKQWLAPAGLIAVLAFTAFEADGVADPDRAEQAILTILATGEEPNIAE